MFAIGSTVIHPIHGLGKVTDIKEQEIMGQKGSYACIFFEEAKLSINVRADGTGSMIRPLISATAIDEVMQHLRSIGIALPSKSTDRYNINLQKLKSNDIFKLAEVVRDLTLLSLERKLSPKDQNMLKQTRRAIAIEFAHLTAQDVEQIESYIDDICRDSREERG